MKEVSIWQLADDPETYGEKSGWFILTSPDGEEEHTVPFETEAQARAFAELHDLTIVPLTA